MIGTVRVVRDERQGGEATGFGSVYETVTVDDAADFDEDGGQFVGPDGTIYDYISVDFDTNELRGDVGFATTLAVEDWIAPWSGDHEDTDRVAEVDVVDGPPVVAVVPHALRALLRPGTRDPGEAEHVELHEPNLGEVEIRDILGKEPGIVGPSIDVPGPGEAGFHVDGDGNVTFGGDDATSGTGTFWAIVDSGSQAWSTIDGYVTDVTNPAQLVLFGIGAGSTRNQGLNIFPPHDDDMPMGSVSIQGLISTGESYITLDADFVDVEEIIRVKDHLRLKVRSSAPTAPPAGYLDVYAVYDGSGFPQIRVKNSAGTTKAMTATDFTDGS